MGAGNLYLARQPILDRQGRMVAYELLFRSSRENAAHISDNLLASSEVMHFVFAELGIEKALGPFQGYLNCDERLLLMKGVLEGIPKGKMVLEILETVEPTPKVVARCRDLKAMGFTLALDDYVGDPGRYLDLLPLVDVVKVDLLRLGEADLAPLVEALRPLGARLLAEKVDRREQADHCRDLGFALFQGYYFARPTMLEGRRLGQSQTSLLRLIGLLMQDGDTGAVERIFKQEPGLTLNLLKLVNSVGMGQVNPITTMRQALLVLGQRQLLRWLQLLLYTSPGDVANPLLQLAASRGRLMELVAADLWPAQPDMVDQAFMAGLMSLMPTLLSVPMGEILAALPISGELEEALRFHRGPLGGLLKVMEALDSEEGEGFAHPEGLDADRFTHHLVEAMAWANELGQG